jgi:subtilisin family serine protease
MKTTLLLPFFLLLGFSLMAQQTRLDLDALNKLNANSSESSDMLVKGDVSKIRSIVSAYNGSFRYSAGNIASVSISSQGLKALVNEPSVLRIEARSASWQLLNDSMIYNNNVAPVHSGMSPLPQGYDGTGVVIGIIDTGIDFTHPDFKDSNGNTRIKYLWDQNQPVAANTPLPYNYGQEWDSTAIDSGGASAHSDVANWGHGTHVTGIAAGNGLALNEFKGVAPGADIIVVAMELSNSTGQRIADAANYIYSKAQAMGKPCVINASVGDYYGSHDGLDLEAQMIDNLITAQNGRAFVAAAGNAGNYPFHLGYNVTSDTTFTWFAYNSSAPSLLIQVWADTLDFQNVDFAIGADQTGNWSMRGRTGFSDISQHLNILINDTIYNNGNRIGVVQTYGSLIGGTYLMEFNIIPDSTSYLWRLITTGTGKFDSWNFGLVSSGLPTAATYPDMIYYKAPDTTQTIVSSFQCLDNVITVGNYNNRDRHYDYNNVLQIDTTVTPGALAGNSSIGPTRDGRVKPDIAASGAYTMSCAVLSLVPAFITNAPQVLAQGGYHIQGGGTSAASPVVAGIAALYLQANPNATYAQVKTAIISCTKQDQFTGTFLPNNAWGYGKVDAMQVLTGCTTGMEDNNGASIAFAIYPNPLSGHAVAEFENAAGAEITFTIYNTVGQAVRTITTNGNSIYIDRSGLDAGVYFCTLSTGSRTIAMEKLVIL